MGARHCAEPAGHARSLGRGRAPYAIFARRNRLSPKKWHCTAIGGTADLLSLFSRRLQIHREVGHTLHFPAATTDAVQYEATS